MTVRPKKQIIIPRAKLKRKRLDIGGRDIVIGFNEPRIRPSDSKSDTKDLDSKLNARLPSYFLPAVIIAQKQNIRPRLFVVSAIIAAFLWNTDSEQERKIVMMNNNLKKQFLSAFLDRFFPDAFSLVECITMQDVVKIEEDKIDDLWTLIETKYPQDAKNIRAELATFISTSPFDEKAITDALKYAVIHLFGTGDINFEGNYIHNPIGYVSIGGEKEMLFNTVRELSLRILREDAHVFFGRDVIMPNNIRVVIKGEEFVPPPYTGYTSSRHGVRTLDEVTYENGRTLDYYDTHKKLHWDMDFFYEYVDREAYALFWEEYKSEYQDLKQRFIEAYKIVS